MSRPLPLICLLLLVLAAPDAFANTVRYFGVWSYNENAPAQEIPTEALTDRRLGYWALDFDEQGGVVSATYHGSDGTPWVSFWYAESHGRVYANLYRGPDPVDSEFISRKSTQLGNRAPHFSAKP